MRLIDADELMEHVWRDKLDCRGLIAEMVNNAPTVKVISTNIPISIFERLNSQEPCEDAISRKEAISIASIATLSVNQVVTALEKLPSVNPQKPICASYEKKLNKWIGAEVLDEIRAEIENKYESISDTYHHYETGFTDALEWALSLIDKHIEESEE